MDVRSLIDDLNFIADECEMAPCDVISDPILAEEILSVIHIICTERIKEYDADGVVHNG